MTSEQIADLAAVAILAAAKEVAPDDVHRVALAYAGGNQRGRRGPVAQVRAYAAVALRSRTKLSKGMIERLVCAPNVIWRVTSEVPGWWEDGILDRVGAALDAYLSGGWRLGLRDRETAPVAAPAPALLPSRIKVPAFLPSRPLDSGKRALLDDLRRAVENTARMTPRD